MLRPKTCHLGLNREPFKMWLARLGNERIDEVFDPEVAANRVVNYYRAKAIVMNGLNKD